MPIGVIFDRICMLALIVWRIEPYFAIDVRQYAIQEQDANIEISYCLVFADRNAVLCSGKSHEWRMSASASKTWM